MGMTSGSPRPMLHLSRMSASTFDTSLHDSTLTRFWRWSLRPASLTSHLNTCPDAGCQDLYIIRRCSSGGGDGTAFIACDQSGSLCVLKKTNISGFAESQSALNTEAATLRRVWPQELASRVSVAVWNGIPFLSMPHLRIISVADSVSLCIDVAAAVRAHIEELVEKGCVHSDLSWSHVACFLRNGQPCIVFIDWTRVEFIDRRIDFAAARDKARCLMLKALKL
jgi:hypothetical protein